MNIQGYKIGRKIGQGGMATVYLAKQIYMDRDVALKIMSPTLATDPAFGERFLREGKIIAQLVHPRIVSVFDVGVNNHLHYIAMEYYPEGELKDKIAIGINTNQALIIIKQVADALNFAHEQGYIHRDVKPENILFDSDGNAVLSDFGIARGTNSATQMTQVGSIVGTPHYMSPEQAKGEMVDGRADLYSLGVVLYEVLTGEVPFDADSGLAIGIKHITDNPPDLENKYAALQPILDKLLAKEPGDRYQNGNELIKDIEHIESGGGLQRPVTDTIIRPSSGINTPLPSSVLRGIDKDSTSAQAGVMKMIMVLIFAVLLLAGVGVYYVDSQGYINIAELIGIKRDIAPDDVPPVAVKTTQIQVERLLKQAAEAIDKQWYTTPAGSSARDKYRAVISIDSVNTTAKQGLDGINAYYVKLSKEFVLSGNFPKAEQALANVDSDYPWFSSTEELIRRTKLQYAEQKSTSSNLTNEKKRQKEIAALFKAADSAIIARRFLIPVGNNAYEKYRQIIEIDPGNERATEGINKIGERYIALSNSAIRNKKFDEAEKSLSAAESVVPLDNRLVDLRDRIVNGRKVLHQRNVSGRSDKLKKISRLLVDAENAYFDDRMVSPKGDNAQDKYMQILKLDGANKKAQDGLDKIVDHFVNLADMAISSEKFDEAVKHINGIKYNSRKVTNIKRKLDRAKREYEDRISISRVKTENQRRINELSVEAESYFADEEYSNALNKYVMIQEISENNRVAIFGINRIVNKLSSLAKSAADDEDFTAADDYFSLIPLDHGKYKLTANYLEEKRVAAQASNEQASDRKPAARRRRSTGGGF